MEVEEVFGKLFLSLRPVPAVGLGMMIAGDERAREQIEGLGRQAGSARPIPALNQSASR